VNGGRNYNGPKVNDSLALVKSGYMLEGLSIPRYEKETSRDNALGADNQQERPVGRNRSGARSARFVEGRDFGRAVEVLLLSRWNPQRLYARFQLRLEKI
jgi:hypothetical protein